MKENYCDITFVIDRSGSMSTLRNDVIGAFNTFVDDQKKVEGEATLTLIQFDHEYLVNYIGLPLDKVEHLNEKTYVPNGTTAMLDAIGRAIITTGERLRDMKESQRPDKVVIVIQTDGYENASREFSYEQINKMVKEQQDKYSWEFVFLGANIDAAKTADYIGIKAGNAMTYAASATGMANAVSSVSENLTLYRCCSKVDMSYEAKDFAAQAQEGVAQ